MSMAMPTLNVCTLSNIRVASNTQPPPIGTIETTHGKGVEVTAERIDVGSGHVDAGALSKGMRQGFSSTDIAFIVARRKLGDPQTAVRGGELSFGPGATQRGPWRDEHGQPAA
jgi:hypothetical protein